MKNTLISLFRVACLLVVFPVGFVVLYPLVVLLLPETMARLADLPRDLALFLLVEAGLVPLIAIGFYRQARYRALGKGSRDFRDTRDVL